MGDPDLDEPRLARLTTICGELPEVVRELTAGHAAFRVRKRIFAWYLADHHGDGIYAVSCKAAPGRNAELIASAPDRYYMPSYSGPRGWVALRLDTAEVDWQEVAGLVVESYLMTAPKRLAVEVTSG